MLPLSNVAWGPTDALTRDSHFPEKWVEPDEIKMCLRSDNWLISGEKGSGKSAIRRALVEIYGEKYLVAPVVDFNDISFRVLHENLVELATTTKLSKTATLSHYWQYAIIVEVISAAAHRDSGRYADLLNTVPRDRADVPLNERLMKLLEEAWNKIDEFTDARTQESKKASRAKANLLPSSGLTAKFLQGLSKFPLGPDFEELKQAFFKRIEESRDSVVLILDGFDRLKTDVASHDTTQLIFASLVDAVQAIHTDPFLPPTFELKAFIPHDRYLSLPLRDSDKIDTMHVSIRWTRENLQAFLKRRLDLTPRLQTGGNFYASWRQVMPEHVTNSMYRLDEDSFDYLVRHSMMRPRQLQIHLEHLATGYHDRNIDPSMVPPAVSESSRSIAKYFVDEFRTDHPWLGRFVTSMHKKDNVMEYKGFRLLVEAGLRRYDTSSNPPQVEDMVDSLYGMGFFGVVNFIEQGREAPSVYCPPTKESRRHFVDCFFKNPHPSISGTLQDDSLIALHPVFTDYCNLRLHPSLIVG